MGCANARPLSRPSRDPLRHAPERIRTLSWARRREVADVRPVKRGYVEITSALSVRTPRVSDFSQMSVSATVSLPRFTPDVARGTLRVAMIAPPWIAVPPAAYGGIVVGFRPVPSLCEIGLVAVRKGSLEATASTRVRTYPSRGEIERIDQSSLRACVVLRTTDLGGPRGQDRSERPVEYRAPPRSTCCPVQ